ncbi:alpha/beta hydrolase family protein [Sediminihabitans luteus]|uniref:Alpha/beta hydrolase family protein n=1 Tax=Sediminihabitans luteus TaxID=1138585 RepID=A0A2M9CD28_9CELL|nr:alpha/beta hydrolase [Sediminihabitans luteus]PJJ69297.1 alpha/beta hydrolase family protein [Sediminihabitans luteus]GII98979.1 hypothetical protein Slu03_13570 [Sediminihabitans luteus]
MRAATAWGRAWTFVLGAGMVATSLWVGTRTGDALGANHWLFGVLVALTFTAGVLVLGRLFVLLYRDASDDAPAPPPEPAVAPSVPRLGTSGTVAVQAVASLALVALTWSVLHYQPHVASWEAVDAYASDDVVDLERDEGHYVFVPREPGTDPAELVDRTVEGAPTPEQVATTGLLFYPGEHVDARAFARMLRPVAEAGYVVAVVTPPLGDPSLDPDQGAGLLDDLGVERWVVGGTDVGGQAAAELAAAHVGAGHVHGLLLLGSAPDVDLSDAPLAVLTLWGTQDGVVPPSRIASSRDVLPASTTWARLPGVNHADFGDFGHAPGDERSTVDRDAAREQIQATVLGWLDQVAAGTLPPAPDDAGEPTASPTGAPSDDG